MKTPRAKTLDTKDQLKKPLEVGSTKFGQLMVDPRSLTAVSGIPLSGARVPIQGGR